MPWQYEIIIKPNYNRLKRSKNIMANLEEKQQAFRRLATRRTNAVLDRLRVLGHCANPHLYNYSDEDVRKIFRAIEIEIKAVKAKFQNSNRSEFSL